MIISISWKFNTLNRSNELVKKKEIQDLTYTFSPKIKIYKDFIYILKDTYLLEIEKNQENFKIEKISNTNNSIESKIILENYIKNDFNEKKEIFKTFTLKSKNFLFSRIKKILDFHITKNMNLSLLYLNSSNEIEVIVLNRKKEIILESKISELVYNVNNIITDFQVIEDFIFFIYKTYSPQDRKTSYSIYQFNFKNSKFISIKNIENIFFKKSLRKHFIMEMGSIKFIPNSTKIVFISNFIDINTLNLKYKEMYIVAFSSIKKPIFYKKLSDNLKYCDLFTNTHSNIYLSIPLSQKENIWSQKYFFKIFNLKNLKFIENKIIHIENKTNDLEKWLYITNEEKLIPYSIKSINKIIFYYK